MEIPVLLVVLLGLPFVAAALIVGVSLARRRGHAPAHASREPVHRFQADPAAVQDGAVAPAPVPPLASGRARRAASADRAEDR